MVIERMKLSELIPADYNPRVKLKPGAPEWEALKTSIQRYGYVVPIVWNRQTRHVVGGHQRLNMLLSEGVEEEYVSVIDCDLEKEKQLNIAMNRVEGAWDYEKLGELFEEFDMADILGTGFTAAEISSLFPEHELPDFEDDTGNGGTGGADPEEADEDTAGPVEGEFTVFLSFPSREQAEEWMKAEGIERDFPETRNVVIHVEGISYGD